MNNKYYFGALLTSLLAVSSCSFPAGNTVNTKEPLPSMKFVPRAELAQPGKDTTKNLMRPENGHFQTLADQSCASGIAVTFSNMAASQCLGQVDVYDNGSLISSASGFSDGTTPFFPVGCDCGNNTVRVDVTYYGANCSSPGSSTLTTFDVFKSCPSPTPSPAPNGCSQFNVKTLVSSNLFPINSLSGSSSSGDFGLLAANNTTQTTVLADGSVSATIPTTGGSIMLPGVGTVNFPAGVFNQATQITVSNSSQADTLTDFEATSILQKHGASLPNVLQIKAGKRAPNAPVQLLLNVPQDFVDALPPQYEPVVYSRLWQHSAIETLDGFELVTSEFDKKTNQLKVTLSPEYFNDAFDANGNFQADMVLSSVSTAPGLLSAPGLAPDADFTIEKFDAKRCQGKPIGSPLASVPNLDSKVTDTFHPPSHKGVDFGVPIGTPITAVEDGTIETSGYQISQSSNRFGQPSGWGNYIVVRTKSGGEVLYAHLKNLNGVKNGTPVKKGQSIGLTGNTGGITGPHLHLEYIPKGDLLTKDRAAGRVDPLPCIQC